jgi:hypothetical protein
MLRKSIVSSPECLHSPWTAARQSMRLGAAILADGSLQGERASPPVDRSPDQRLHGECASTPPSPADRSLDLRSHGGRSGSSASPQGPPSRGPSPSAPTTLLRLHSPDPKTVTSTGPAGEGVRRAATRRPLARCAGLDAPAPPSSAPPVCRPNPARPSHLLPIPHTLLYLPSASLLRLHLPSTLAA